MKKKEATQNLRDCAELLSIINTRKMPKIVKEQFENELQDLCLTITRITINIYKHYDQ